MGRDRWTSTSTLYLTPEAGDAWGEEAATTSQTGTQQITQAGEVTPPRDVTRALKLPPDASAIARRRVMFLDGTPVEIVNSYYPATVAAGTGLAEPKKIPGGAVTLLARLGYHPDDVREDITARLPNDEEQQTLGISEHEPVLILHRLCLTNAGVPFEYAVMTMVARSSHLQYRLAG